MTPVGAALAVVCFYGLFYRHIVARCGTVVQWMMRRLQLDVRRSVREVEAVGKLAAAGVAQLLFAVALAWLVGVHPGDLVGPGLRPALLVAAAALGVGELALTSLVCSVIVELTAAAAPGPGDAAARRFAARSRGGWMSYFLLTAQAAPWALTAASVSLYVAVEELIFRGILVHAFSGGGAVAAVVGSTALFVGVQAFGMPSRVGALFPMVGATVVGVVHAILFWRIPDVAPLALAHVTFFAAALSMTSSRALRRA